MLEDELPYKLLQERENRRMFEVAMSEKKVPRKIIFIIYDKI